MKNYILKDENAVYFESGFSCDNVLFLRLGSEGFFITDPRYSSEAKECVKNGIEVIEARDLHKSAREIIKKSKISKLFFNPADLTYSDFLGLDKKLNIKLTPKKEFSKQMRIIKTDEEIAILKETVRLGREGFKTLGEVLKSSVNLSEKEIHYKAKESMSFKGEYDLSFDPITAINENAAKPHALPTNKILQKDDLLLIDAGLKYKRYCSDRTVTLSFGDGLDIENREQRFTNQTWQKIYDIVLKAQRNAIENARVGMKASEIDALARSVIEDAGYGKYFVHSTGHGVGLDIHEYPTISSKSDVIIEENMVFTIEPGIYLDGDMGVRIEDMVVMKGGRAEVM